jgi:hypothetical protein
MSKGKKQQKNLDRRRADYSRMISTPRSDGWVGYRRPGSNKK